jgi:hypothetical protein
MSQTTAKVVQIDIPFTPGLPKKKRPPRPAWDRTIDIVYHRHIKGLEEPGNHDIFQKTLKAFKDDSRRTVEENIQSPYFQLPHNTRQSICQRVMMERVPYDRPVGLADPGFSAEVWPPSYFTDAKDAFGFILSFTEVCFGMYADMMITFLTNCRFHTLMSPFSGPLLSPMATLWLWKYGKYMQHIIVEVDLSRFCFGFEAGAESLHCDGSYVRKLTEKFVETQLDRKEATPLCSLVLLCRRYYGVRHRQPVARADVTDTTELRCQMPPLHVPNKAEDEGSSSTSNQHIVGGQEDENQTQDQSISSETEPFPLLPEDFFSAPTPYCPDEALSVCNPFKNLRGLVDGIRLCGFSKRYAHELIQALFPLPSDMRDLKYHGYRVAPSSLWPRLPGQTSYVDIGDETIVLDNHMYPGPGSFVIHATGPVLLPSPTVEGETGETSVVGNGILDLSSETISEEWESGRKTSIVSSEGDSVALSTASKSSKLRRLLNKLKGSCDTEDMGSLASSKENQPTGQRVDKVNLGKL